MDAERYLSAQEYELIGSIRTSSRSRAICEEALECNERMRRVNEALRQVLADGVERLGDPSLGIVTVTAVRATTDLQQAVVYVSVLGSEKRRARSLRALERARGVLQRSVAARAPPETYSSADLPV